MLASVAWASFPKGKTITISHKHGGLPLPRIYDDLAIGLCTIAKLQ